MKIKNPYMFTATSLRVLLFFAGAGCIFTVKAAAATYKWDSGGASPSSPSFSAGTWNTSNAYWSDGTTDSVWSNAGKNTAWFGGASTYTVTVSGNLTVGGLDFENTSTTTLSGGTLTLAEPTAGSGVLIKNGGTAGVASINSVLMGTANVTYSITGGGSIRLYGANTYSGTTTIEGGQLRIYQTNALPTTTDLAIGNSGVLYWVNGNGKDQTVASLSSAYTTSAIQNASGQALTFTVAGNSSLATTFAGVIKDTTANSALSLVVGGAAGSADLTLTGINTYIGATTINSGRLQISNAGSINSTSGITVNTGGEFAYNSTTALTKNIALQGGSLSGSGSISGAVTGSNATINGSGLSGLSMAGVTLNGTSTLSGYNIASSVTVAGGTTSLTGTTKSTSALSVSAGTMLNANGTIDGSATVSGLLKGNSTVTGSLTLNSTATLVAKVSGTVAGLSYDQVKVSGNVSLDGTLDLKDLSGLTLGNTITLIDNTGSGTTTGYFSTILTSDSTFTVNSSSDYTFTSGATEYVLSFSANSDGGTSFNDVTLTVVPEPSTWAMLVGGVGMLGFAQRLRRRAIK